MSHRELLMVEMKRINLPNMILELRTERLLRISRLRQVLTLVIHVKVFRLFQLCTFGDKQCELFVK
ncbi:hypothetical protein H4683_002394 [Filibacter limicola]|uniref:Uncharacterized protein n=1 Tax=Sporosarcina limicola TaxID=34101 RepID=A0A927MIF6_9BACL|nr:hypothetical protein [Sporosarcina limicola]